MEHSFTEISRIKIILSGWIWEPGEDKLNIPNESGRIK